MIPPVFQSSLLLYTEPESTGVRVNPTVGGSVVVVVVVVVTVGSHTERHTPATFTYELLT